MKKIRIRNIRLVVQLIFLFTVIIAAANHYLSFVGKGITWVSESTFHYICPICGVTSIYQLFMSSSLWVVKLKSTLGIVIGIVIMLSVVFGPVLCGFICPFGAVQDLTARIGRKIFKGRYNNFVPAKIDQKLKYLRYISLLLTIYLTASSSVALLEKINPYHAFFSIFNRNFSIIGSIVLIIVLIMSLFIQRPWCKYLCPYGVFLGLFNKIKVFRIVRNKETCISCRKCSRVCPMSIKAADEQEVRELSCISCMECVDIKVCPKSGAIKCTSEDSLEKEEGITLIK